MDEKMVLDRVKEENISFVYLLFTDITGITKKVTIPAKMLKDALDHGVWFDGSSIEGFARIYESDMLLKLDVSTFAVLPWETSGDRCAQIICDIYLPNETPFEGDPRGVLRRALARAKNMGYEYFTGPELEFFLIDRDDLPDLRPHDKKGYFDMGVQSRAVDLCQQAMKMVNSFGVECESYHHEVSYGQHEIGFKYGNALTMADAVLSLKHVLRYQAGLHNFKVTFMPKPFFGVNGSGMHVHQSLGDEQGNNLFYQGEDPYNLSDLAYQFVAGQIKHAKGLVSVVAPTVNSYKRLVPGFEAPVYICWGRVNRSALLRVPKVTRSRAKKGARVELRCPDPSANPYLAFAAMLTAGLDGIENKMTPPAAVEENVYGFSDEKLVEMEIDTLPKTINEAVSAFAEDDVLTGLFGQHLTEHFIQAKKQEWREFLMPVTPWEIERYL